MKIIHNNIIPFKGYKAINLFGVLFVRGDVTLTADELQHEEIHTAQMKEMLYVFFYLWYVIEWLIRLIGHIKDKNYNAYRNISFEREAYSCQNIDSYLISREKFSWLNYL